MALNENVQVGDPNHTVDHREIHTKVNAFSVDSASGVVLFNGGHKGFYKIGNSTPDTDVAISDEDFTGVTPEGTEAYTFDLTTGLIGQWFKVNGAWRQRLNIGGGAQNPQTAGLVATTAWNPTTAAVISKVGAGATSLTTINDTHLSVSFQVPSSGNVLVRLEGYRDQTVDLLPTYWGLQWEDAGVISTVALSTLRVAEGIDASRAVYTHLITGLTPGSTRTIRWAQAASSGTTTSFAVGSGYGTAVMEVWEAPANVLVDIGNVGQSSGGVPTVPTGLVASAASSTEIQLTWNSVTGAANYGVQRSLDDTTWTTIITTSNLSFRDTGRAINTLYYYRIRAENDAGNSAYTASTSARTLSGGQTGSSFKAFTESSYWNTPLPSTGNLVVATVSNSGVTSEQMLDFLATDNAGGYFRLNGVGTEGPPVYWADSNSPTYNITRRVSGTMNALASTVRIPVGAQPGVGGEVIMVVIDRTANKVYSLKKAVFASSAWTVETASDFAVYHIDSNGITGSRTPSTYPTDNVDNFGNRGQVPTAVAMRWDEYRAGSVDRVVRAMVNSTRDLTKTTFPAPVTGSYVFPMGAGQAGGSISNSAPPDGTRIRIKTTVDLGNRGLSPTALVLAQTLQQYGAIISERSGGATSGPARVSVESLYLEGGLRPPDAPTDWSGLLTTTALQTLPFKNADGTYNWEIASLGWGTNYNEPNA